MNLSCSLVKLRILLRPSAAASLLCVSLSGSPVYAQAVVAKGAGSVLEQRYKAAQSFQAAHDLDKAAQQYRIFIADTLGQIALGHARAGQSDKALNEFDEALTLVPDFPALQLEYARVALEAGNLEHAEMLAEGVLRTHSGDAKLAAKAHALLGRILLKKGKNADAKKQIEQAVALDPTFEYGYALAIADLDLGDGDAAANVFSEMLSSFGDTAAIHMLFGQAYGGSDFQGKAVEQFKAAIAKDDHLPGAHYSLASAYLNTSGNARLPDVEAELHKEIAVSPESASAYAALGHLLASQHDNPTVAAEALQDLKRAAELDPKNPDAFLYLGQFCADAKMFPEAEVALRRSIVLTNDVSRNGFQVQKAHYILGRLLIQTGRPDEGKQEIAASQALLQRNLSRDQDRLADYLGSDRANSAQDAALDGETAAAKDQNAEQATLTEQFEKQFGPALADSYNNLGAIAGSKENYRLALRYFERAEEWNPTLPGLDYNWGRAAFAAGAASEAVGPLARYLHEHPEDDGARTVLGLSQFLSKDYAGARKTLDPIADKNSEPVQAQYAYAKSLIETNDRDRGIARLLALEKAAPNISDVHRALGEVYEEQGDPKASEEFETAIRLNPHDAEAYIALGHLQLAHGDAKAALPNLEAALKLQPDNADLQKQLEECKRKVTHE